MWLSMAITLLILNVFSLLMWLQLIGAPADLQGPLDDWSIDVSNALIALRTLIVVRWSLGVFV